MRARARLSLLLVIGAAVPACGLSHAVWTPRSDAALDADAPSPRDGANDAPVASDLDAFDAPSPPDVPVDAPGPETPAPRDVPLVDVAPDARPDAAPDAPADAGTPFCDVRDPTLALCVRFEDSAVDESPAGHTVTPRNTAYQTGAVGRAIATQMDSSITVSPDVAPGATVISYEAWVRPASVPASDDPRMMVIDNDGSWGLDITPGGAPRCLGGDGTATAPDAIPATHWTHLACTIDGSTVRIYVDGTERARDRATDVNPPTAPVRIGENAPDGNDQFLGRIDEVRVFARVLDAGEIAASARRLAVPR